MPTQIESRWLAKAAAVNHWGKFDATHSHHGWLGHEDPTSGHRAKAEPAAEVSGIKEYDASLAGMPAAQARTLFFAERGIAHNRTESLYAIDAAGKIVHTLHDDPANARNFGSIRVSEDDLKKFDGENVILTHNHPSSVLEHKPGGVSNSLSIEDLQVAFNSEGVHAIRAVSPGAVYEFSAPAGATFQKEQWPSVNRAYESVNAQLHNNFENEAQSIRGLSESNSTYNQLKAKYSEAHWDSIMSGIAEATGFNYKKHLLSSPLGGSVLG